MRCPRPYRQQALPYRTLFTDEPEEPSSMHQTPNTYWRSCTVLCINFNSPSTNPFVISFFLLFFLFTSCPYSIPLLLLTPTVSHHLLQAAAPSFASLSTIPPSLLRTSHTCSAIALNTHLVLNLPQNSSRNLSMKQCRSPQY